MRYFPLDRPRLDEAAVDEAFQTADASGLTLATLMQDFLVFLVEWCGKDERGEHIAALSSIQTGSIGADALRASRRMSAGLRRIGTSGCCRMSAW